MRYSTHPAAACRRSCRRRSASATSRVIVSRPPLASSSTSSFCGVAERQKRIKRCVTSRALAVRFSGLMTPSVTLLLARHKSRKSKRASSLFSAICPAAEEVPLSKTSSLASSCSCSFQATSHVFRNGSSRASKSSYNGWCLLSSWPAHAPPCCRSTASVRSMSAGTSFSMVNDGSIQSSVGIEQRDNDTSARSRALFMTSS